MGGLRRRVGARDEGAPVLQHGRLHFSPSTRGIHRANPGNLEAAPHSIRAAEGRRRRARLSAIRSDEDRVCDVRPAGRRRACAPRVRSDRRSVPSIRRRRPDGSCRAGCARRRAAAEHPHERPCGDAQRGDVRARARAMVSESVSRAHGVAHPDAARARPLLRHAAGRRPLYVSEYAQLEFPWRDGMGRAAARQSRLSRAAARIRSDGPGHQRPRVRSQPRCARARLPRRTLSADVESAADRDTRVPLRDERVGQLHHRPLPGIFERVGRGRWNGRRIQIRSCYG